MGAIVGGQFEIAGFGVSCFEDLADAATKIYEQKSDSGLAIFALNAEKVVGAMGSRDKKTLLERADVLYPDGIGVVKAIQCKHGKRVARIPGCDLWLHMLVLCKEHQESVFLVGARPQVLKLVENKLKSELDLDLVGSRDGYFQDEAKLIEEIKQSNAGFVSVALGSPRQEEFILRCKEAGVRARMMGVGGTYDVYAGAVKRAPGMYQKYGLEWLYRLLSDPTRFTRQLNLLKFLWLLVTKRV